MIIYVVDPIKQTTEAKGAGVKDSLWEVRWRTGEEGNRIENKNQVSVDRVVRAARLGAPSERVQM